MSGLVFRSQFASNFQSLGVVEFPLDKVGMVAIRGRNLDDSSAQENGVGKTSLLDSIVCTLYGRIPRYSKQVKGSQILNRHSGEKTSTLETAFAIGSIDYMVSRVYSKRSHKLQLLQGDSDISEASIPRTQEKIVQLIGTYQAFLNSIMFGRGVISRFVKADKVERGEIVASLVMDTESFESMRKGVEKQYVEKQNEYSTVADRIASATDVRSRKKDDLHSERVDLKQLQLQKKEQLRSIKPPEQPKKGDAALTNQISKVSTALDSIEQAQNRIRGDLNYNLGKQSDVRQYSGIFESTKGDFCPVCQESLSKEKKKDIRLVYSTLEDNLLHEYKKKKALVGKLEARIGALKKSLSVLENERNEIADARIKYDHMRLAYLNMKSILDDQEVKAWERLTHTKNAYADSRVAVKRLLQIHKGLRLEVKDLVFLRKAFSTKGIMAEVVKTVCPKLTMLSQQFVSRFLGGGYQIQFIPELVTFRGEERLSFDIHASVEKGGGEYAACSDGEQERIDTCVGLALRYLVSSRFGHKVNLLAFDERFSGLDTLGSEKVMELITEEAKKQSTVLVVSHQEHLQQYFEKQWVVVKENGVARLELPN